MTERTHIDCFSGIGGFALAAQANGLRTVQFVEKDKRCRDFLAKAWPGVAIHDDVTTFHWDMADTGSEPKQTQTDGWEEREQDNRDNLRSIDGVRTRGSRRTDTDGNQRDTARPFLLTAGVPCQPASRAGKQRGAEDDRWLWDDAVRILQEARPTWALFENPPGIGDVGLDGILSEVAGSGYEVGPVLDIPACAVDAPHLRHRYWIVAHAVSERGCGGATGGEHAGDADAPVEGQHGLADERGTGNVADNEGESKRAGLCEAQPGRERRRRPCDGVSGFWADHTWLPCADGKFRRAPDHIVGVADGLQHGVPAPLGEGKAAWPTPRHGKTTAEELSTWQKRADKGDVSTLPLGAIVKATWPTTRSEDSELTGPHRGVADTLTSAAREANLHDGIPIGGERMHRSILAALGNSIVWQVAAEIIAAICEADDG